MPGPLLSRRLVGRDHDLFEYSIDRVIDGVRSQAATAHNTGATAE